MSSYKVKVGETITDVLLNSTGTINNWRAVVDANDFDSLTPDLVAGQVVIIPSTAEIQTNVLNSIQSAPSCNNLMIKDWGTQLTSLVALFNI